MTEFIINNWQLFIVALAAAAVVIMSIKTFVTKPTPAQVQQVKEWLLWAVTEAERTLGSGTGSLKLRYVYDLFVTRFPVMAHIVAFDTFSSWVDEVLNKFRNMLESNKNVKNYVDHSKENE